MYKGHEASISSLKYSPDGLWIASGDEKGDVKVSIHFFHKPNLNKDRYMNMIILDYLSICIQYNRYIFW